MPTESGAVVKEDRCVSPVRDLVLDGTGSSYVVPAVLSYCSSNGEKNKSEPWDGDAYLYAAIIPGTYGAAMSYALWCKKMNRDCSCQECKTWCLYWWGKVMERGWNCLMLYTTARYSSVLSCTRSPVDCRLRISLSRCRIVIASFR